MGSAACCLCGSHSVKQMVIILFLGWWLINKSSALELIKQATPPIKQPVRQTDQPALISQRRKVSAAN